MPKLPHARARAAARPPGPDRDRDRGRGWDRGSWVVGRGPWSEVRGLWSGSGSGTGLGLAWHGMDWIGIGLGPRILIFLHPVRLGFSPLDFQLNYIFINI